MITLIFMLTFIWCWMGTGYVVLCAKMPALEDGFQALVCMALWPCHVIGGGK